jgi:hypothetical protein
MRISPYLISFALLMGAVAPSFAQGSPTPEYEASRSLDKFKRLAKTEGNWEKLGFERPEDVDASYLGVGFKVYMVRLDKLRMFNGNLADILESTEQYIVPLLYGERAAAGFFIEGRRDGYRTTSFGSPALINLLDATRRKVASKKGGPKGAFFVVRVAALNQYFLGHVAARTLQLTPILDDRAFDFVAGQTLDGCVALRKLQVAAMSHNGNPT